MAGGEGEGDCFEGRAGRPVPAMALSDVPHKPRPRAFTPPGHGLAIFPRSLSLACLAVLRPRVPLPRYFVAAAHQSTPGPWCRGGVGLLCRLRYAAIPCVCGVFFVAETSVTCAHGCTAMFAGHRVPSVIAHRPRHACRVLDKHSLAAAHRAVFKFNCHVLHPLA